MYPYPSAKLIHALYQGLGEEIWSNEALPLPVALDFLNEGARVLSRLTRCIQTFKAANIAAATNYYTLATLGITDAIDNSIFAVRIKDAADATARRALTFIPYEEFLRPDRFMLNPPTAAPIFWTWDPHFSAIRFYPAAPAAVTEGMYVHYAKEPTAMRRYIYNAEGRISIASPAYTAVTGINTTWKDQGAVASDWFGAIKGDLPDKTLPLDWSAIATVPSDSALTLSTAYPGPKGPNAKYIISDPCEIASLYSDTGAAPIIAYAKSLACERLGRPEQSPVFMAAFDAGAKRLLAVMTSYQTLSSAGTQLAPAVAAPQGA